MPPLSSHWTVGGRERRQTACYANNGGVRGQDGNAGEGGGGVSVRDRMSRPSFLNDRKMGHPRSGSHPREIAAVGERPDGQERLRGQERTSGRRETQEESKNLALGKKTGETP